MKLRQNKSMRPTNDSERSPSVYYANWKEDMVLQKQLTTLNRTERGLLHRITVDQKVTFRRFQAKLQRSKIAHARLWGDKEAEQRLRGIGMRKLHSESHMCGEGEEDFLAKLKQRPYEGKNGKSVEEITVESAAANSQNLQNGVTDKDMTSIIEAVLKEKPVTTTAKNIRSLTTLGCLLDEAQTLQELHTFGNNSPKAADNPGLQLRPATSGVAEMLRLKYQSKPSPIVPDLPPVTSPSKVEGPEDGVEHIETEETSMSQDKVKPNDKIIVPQAPVDGGSGQMSLNVALAKIGMGPRVIPKLEISRARSPDSGSSSSSADASSCSDENSSRCEPPEGERQGKNVMNRRRIQFKSPQDNLCDFKVYQPKPLPPLKRPRLNARRGSTIFEEVKRPDYCQMRLNLAREVDHSDLVQLFCDRLSDLGEGSPQFDYYADKMQASAAQQMKDPLPSIPDIPEDMYRRHAGDQTVKCITLKSVKLSHGVKDDEDVDYQPWDDVPDSVMTPRSTNSDGSSNL